MKEVTKTIEERYTVYEAVDGTEFSSEGECKAYEDSAKCALLHKYNELVIRTSTEEAIFNTGSDDYKIDVVKLSKKDAALIMQLFYLFNPCYMDKDSSKAICDKIYERVVNAANTEDILFIGRDYHMDCFWPLVTRNEFLSNFEAAIKPQANED